MKRRNVDMVDGPLLPGIILYALPLIVTGLLQLLYNAADMMHVIVLVRTEVGNEHQTVLFKVPSSLIPMVEYMVELDGTYL